jgi:hypothetical protein
VWGICSRSFAGAVGNAVFLCWLVCRHTALTTWVATGVFCRHFFESVGLWGGKKMGAPEGSNLQISKMEKW